MRLPSTLPAGVGLLPFLLIDIASYSKKVALFNTNVL